MTRGTQMTPKDAEKLARKMINHANAHHIPMKKNKSKKKSS